MFYYLPYDCIILIIDNIYEGKEDNKKINYINDWKKMKKYNILKQKYTWGSPQFANIINMIYTSKNIKNIFDRNDVWSYIYAKEFRNSKPFKRIPTNMKLRMKQKTKNILLKRYKPIIEHIRYNKEIEQSKISEYSESINKLSEVLNNTDLTIRIDENDKKISDLYVKISGGFRDRWGNFFEHDFTISYFYAARDLQWFILRFNISNKILNFYLEEEKEINNKMRLF